MTQLLIELGINCDLNDMGLSLGGLVGEVPAALSSLAVISVGNAYFSAIGCIPRLRYEVRSKSSKTNTFTRNMMYLLYTYHHYHIYQYAYAY